MTVRLRRVKGDDPAGHGGLVARRRGVLVEAGSPVADLVHRQFLAHYPDRQRQQDAYGARLDEWLQRLVAIEGGGIAMTLTEEVHTEAGWLLNYTTNWPRLDATLARLADSFGRTDQDAGTRQSTVTGGWGQGYTEWFLSLDSSIDRLNELSAEAGGTVQHPMWFTAPFTGVERMTGTLESLRLSDIPRTGIDQRDAFGGVTTFLSEILFKDDLRSWLTAQQPHTRFAITPAMVDGYRAWQDLWQDPATGFWGAWYRDDDGRIVKAPDLSFTFHTVSYRRGDVNLWPQIIDTLLGMKDGAYPYGWKSAGQFVNHNNYDVLKIFKYGWKRMTAEDKARSVPAIRKLIDWCLNSSLQPDGSFAPVPGAFSSVGDDFYYGVVFLNIAGYWAEDTPFWTTERAAVLFPEAGKTAALIEGRLKVLNLKAESAQEALRIVTEAADRLNATGVVAAGAPELVS